MDPLPTEFLRIDIFVEDAAMEDDKVGEIRLACAPITNRIWESLARINGSGASHLPDRAYCTQ